MRFGLEDEVTGHCSTWVVLDNETLVRKRYPELAEIIADEMPAAWRELTGHAKQLSSASHKAALKSKRRQATSSIPLPRGASRRNQVRKSNLSVVLGSISVAAIAIAAALYVRSRNEIAIPVTQIAELASQNDLNPFLDEMGLKLDAVVHRVAKGKDKDGVWLPYLRMYAFHTNGSIENLSLKTLRGAVSASAPQDCSVEGWKKRWFEGEAQVEAWITGKASTKNSWTKILSWDPWWVRRREVEGWFKPKNWYEGCLMAASVAIRSVSEDVPQSSPSRQLIETTANRLVSQLAIIQGGVSNAVPEADMVTGRFTCMDQAVSSEAIDQCMSAEMVQKNSQLEEYGLWQKGRIIITQALRGPEKLWGDNSMQAISARLESLDNYSKLDYSPESHFIKDSIKSGANVEVIESSLGGQFLEVKFRK
jgi:hypothetical protein